MTPKTTMHLLKKISVIAVPLVLLAAAPLHAQTAPSPVPTPIPPSPTVTSLPYAGTPYTIPGIIEAENYDNGSQGMAYYDTDMVNNGNQYRTGEGVDVKTASDTGGYAVGWVVAGEWQQYTVSVATTSAYSFSARVAAIATGKMFHVEIDGVNVTGAVVVPQTGTAWDTTWGTTATVSGINLTAGTHVMRIVANSSEFDYNYFTWTKDTVSASDTQAPSVPTGLTGTAVSQTQVNLTWTASTDNVGVMGYNIFRNGTKVGTSSTTSYSDTGLLAGTTYSYTVSAYDAVGNISAQSGVSITTPAPVFTTFMIGDRVKTTTRINVRSTPSTSGTVLCKQRSGKLGTVVGGPVSANGYVWRQVNFDASCDGWAVETYLTKTLATTQTTTLAQVPSDASTVALLQAQIADLLAQVLDLRAKLQAAVGMVR